MFVAQYSHPLNYKSKLVRLSESNWIQTPATYLSERKGSEYVSFTPSRITFKALNNDLLYKGATQQAIIVAQLLSKSLHFYWLTLSLELYSPLSQSGALPVKLKPTYYFDTGFRLELKIADSNSAVLPITLSGDGAAWVIRTLSSGLEDRCTAINAYAAYLFCGSYGNWTRGNRSTICDVTITPTNHVICTGFEPVSSSRKLDILNH